jgi:TATA-box binding protein (TBP) (component of TFIID and TFIIIB)
MAAFGKLVVTNVVTIYCVRVADKKKPNGTENKDGYIDLIAIALVGKGNYGPSFPAVQNKGRCMLRYVKEQDEKDDDFWFPLVPRAKAERTIKAKKSKAPRIDANVPIHASDFLKATNAVFKSGSVVVAGGTTVNENRLVAYTFIRRINHDTKQTLRIFNLHVVNIVSCTDLGFELNCEWMYEDGQNKGLPVLYDPEEFMGLSWSTEENGLTIVFVIFATGKVIATSMTRMSDIAVAERRIQQLVVSFRKGNEPAGYEAASHMRDANTLDVVRVKAHGKDAPVRVSATLRNQRKLTQDMKKKMKEMRCIAELNEGLQIVLHQGDEFEDYFLSHDLE